MGDGFDIKFADNYNVLGLVELGEDCDVSYATFDIKGVRRLLEIVEKFDKLIDVGLSVKNTTLLIMRPHTIDSNLWFAFGEYLTGDKKEE